MFTGNEMFMDQFGKLVKSEWIYFRMREKVQISAENHLNSRQSRNIIIIPPRKDNIDRRESFRQRQQCVFLIERNDPFSRCLDRKQRWPKSKFPMSFDKYPQEETLMPPPRASTFFSLQEKKHRVIAWCVTNFVCRYFIFCF